MEIFILVLSSLIAITSPLNLAGDKVAEKAICAQLKGGAEQLQVRIDNAPTHDLLKGKVERLRVAGRGLFPLKDVRIDTLELETDPVNLNRKQLQQRGKRGKLVLDEPLGAGLHVVMRETDLTQALKSPVVTKQIQTLLRGLGGRQAGSATEYRVLSAKVDFLGDRRLAATLEVEDATTSEKLKVDLQTGIDLINGRRLAFVQPQLAVNGQQFPAGIVKQLTDGIADRFDPDQLSARYGIKTKILRFDITSDTLDVVTFIQLPAGFKL